MIKISMKIFLLLFLTMGIQSCKLFKGKTRHKGDKISVADTMALAKTDTAGVDSVSVMVPPDAATIEAAHRTAEVWGHALDCSSMSAKAKMNYKGDGKDLDFTAHIRLKKDSVIWVSVVLGGIIQVARAIITPDSFKAILNTERKAFVGPVSRVKEVLPEGLDFYTLQNLLLGNRILNTDSVLSVNDASPLRISFVRNVYTEQCVFPRETALLVQSLLTISDQSMRLQHDLSGYQVFADRQFSTQRKIQMTRPEQQVFVNIEFSQVEFNGELSFPFNVPKNYTLK